jgi:ABC-type nickel/cobalt efflux system permease component RcnA
VAVILRSVAGGIAFTIGIVALLAIAARRVVGERLVHRLSNFERGARIVQGIAAIIIIAIALYSMWKST